VASLIWAQLLRPVPADVSLLTHLETFDKWVNVANIDLPFQTYHSQGIVKIGRTFYLTAIGSSAGYLIEFAVERMNDIAASQARLIKEVQLADPEFKLRIHAGGIDYDERTNRIWCPLAEKTAGTSTSILTINPSDLSYEHVGSIMDHLGTTIVDTESGRIRMIDYHTGMYSFQLNPDGSFPAEAHTADKFVLPSEPIEYQDCKCVSVRYAVCAGHSPHRVDVIHFDADVRGNTATPYSIAARYPLGATNLGREAMTFEVLKSSTGHRFVRFYFKPDDGMSTKLRIYDAWQRREESP
jgi:hypothetical protein